MTISEELAAFRSRVPGCRVVAFADLSTGMVLAASTAEKTAQEKLDALCVAATDALSGMRSQSIATAFAALEKSPPRIAICADTGSMRCFFGAECPATEALCCVLAPDASLDGLFDRATGLLDQLASGG